MLAPQALTAGHLPRWRAVVLELHQHELLGRGAGRAAGRAGSAHPGILNDLRSIFIAHDKRLLALLSMPASCRITWRPTTSPGCSTARRADLGQGAGAGKSARSAGPSRRLAGQTASLRQGQRASWSPACFSPAEWRQTLTDLPEDWVLQPYVEQQAFPIAVVRDGDLVTAPMQVVGMLPTLDEHAFGPGLYRAAQEQVVNVARGGVILAAAIEKRRKDVDASSF